MKYVLFICTQNAGRSQMAQAFFERYAPEDLRAESAGQEPAKGIHPEVVAAMAEVGIDLSGRAPKKLTVEMQRHADWAITLACGARCPEVPTVVEDWDIPDPAGKPIEEVRAIRDGIEERVKDLLETRVEDIRSDKTAHMQRLDDLLPELMEEFSTVRDPEEILLCANAVLSDYDGVPIRTHVVTLAKRRIVECLRAETCHELERAR